MQIDGIFHDVDGPQDTFIGTINSDPDARLIAAAPELLEAAKYIDFASGSGEDLDDGEYVSFVITMKGLKDLRAAIQKAEGGNTK